MVAIAAIGEVMIELAPVGKNPEGETLLRLGVAGDTFNTAVYLARLGLQTHYVTLLGDDIYSAEILRRLTEENIGTASIGQIPGRRPGLYMIENLVNGERQFSYWRSEAPARDLFDSDLAAADIFERLRPMRAIYLSGITLAIISESARQRLFKVLSSLREAGATIIFDSNYRPRLWRSVPEAQAAIGAIMQYVDIALITLEDEEMLWQHNSIAAVVAHYENGKAIEWIIKQGAEQVLTYAAGEYCSVPVPRVDNVRDTTGAGDTFNAGYLAARLSGATAVEAVKQGIRCAGIIIQHAGAIVPRQEFFKQFF